MRLKRGEYQGSPEWILETRRWKLYIDWNTRFPFGFSAGMKCTDSVRAWSWCLDLNPPLGEPNQLYLNWTGWNVILGLPSVRGMRPTGRYHDGTEIWEQCRTRPHIERCDRYRYHQDDHGRWVRNENPDPLYWGWLTIHRKDGR